MIKICSRCGGTFEIVGRGCGRAKYCPDCREDVYKEFHRECNRRYYAAQCGEKRVRNPENPQKKRLAYLRRRLIRAQTPDERSKYFRLYVLLKQEVLRNNGSD